MHALRRSGHDPFWDDGVGARRQRIRRRVVGALAFALAVAACGLTTAAWMIQLAPITARLLG